MALQAPIFPIDQPVMPEDRQIGRKQVIAALHARVDAVTHQWLIGPRRIGKTSLAKAVLARLRLDGAVALDVDLSKLDLSSTHSLAGELARQAQAAGAGVANQGRRLFERVRRHAPASKGFGRTLKELGLQDEGEALVAVASLLASADGGAPGLGSVLEALALHAHATSRHVVVLLDEVHLLSRLAGAEEEVARWAGEPGSPIIFIFAGSEESAVQTLREPDRPLAPIGQEFHLPDIGTEDWLAGLRSRFAEANVAVTDEALFSIIEASNGHPRRTMLAASYVRTEAEGQLDRAATHVVVELAIRNAQADRSWT